MASDYYKALGLAKTATPAEIKKAYRRLAVQYHPDKNQGNREAEDKFKEINEAYAVLSDATKKEQYDRFGSTGFHQRFSQEDIFRGFNMDDLFRDMGFGGGIFGSHSGGRAGHGTHRRPSKGADATAAVRISLREAATGCERRLAVTRAGRREDLAIRIPAGMEDGGRLRVPGKGGEGLGGPSGDLYVTVTVDADPVFTREGNDLVVERLITFSEACLGTTVDVPSLETPKRLKVPAGIQPGTKMRLKGLGIGAGGQAKGDLYVRISIEVPQHLDEERKKLVMELGRMGL